MPVDPIAQGSAIIGEGDRHATQVTLKNAIASNGQRVVVTPDYSGPRMGMAFVYDAGSRPEPPA